MTSRVGVGLIGSQFISAIHARALQRCPAAELVAVASPTPGHAQQLAETYAVPHHFTHGAALLARDDIQLVVIGAPNHVHCDLTVQAAQAGKHVVVEKPLCLTLLEADRMIATCREAGVKLMYAEELCFAPKYIRLRQLLQEGALGAPTLLKQSEKHSGPHADHFWDVRRSGGGVTMDMGCHAIGFFRWLLDRRPIRSVYAQMSTQVHGKKTLGDDNALIVLEFEGDVTALAEESWTKLGGMDDRAEVQGSAGVAYADLLQGNSIQTYSQQGYGYAVEKAGGSSGWSFAIYEEEWNYGFPQELAHFVDCVQNDRQPQLTGEDGRDILEVVAAAYESAATGSKVRLPFQPLEGDLPIDPWLRAQGKG